ncbi:ATG C terminal domain-containing protein [Xylaria bambusicola]|uniref:ATG C terminal domain-containing protein n=1 Tax=Xylaria bambusicola TaxID=326684 RepID=UPI002007DAD6|nr:ATG C terminal domain-containing protein [Xylaria bambusicola]KAI0506303.1 ATG C terminal domain-containing protein [Xylaria bambusicola]
MAAYFQSFWTSSVPKRLLRYVLFKLDYFETGALDLDKIDVAWGQASQITWQDVGLKIDKLEKLLQLPPSIEIQKAKVLALRVTIPAAIYSTPIHVEADGVEIKLRIVPTEEQNAARKRTSKQKDNNNSIQSARDESVPHAIDLAQSFLETQPRKEKEELQAALNAETQDLAASVASSDDGSEDDDGFGTGQPLSLPAFLADFIQGIVDRLEFAIKHVTCHLDVEVPLEANSSTNERVTFQLAIDGINAEGVTSASEAREQDSIPTHKEGKRFVELNNIRASLISEADVFSALSRTSSMPPSVGATSPIATTHRPLSREPTTIPTTTPLNDYLADSTDLDDVDHHPLMDSEDAFNIPYDLETTGDNPIDDDETRSTPSTPRASTSRNPIDSPPRTTPSVRPAQSTMATRRAPWTDLPEPAARSEHLLEQLGRWGAASNNDIRDEVGSTLSSSQSSELSPSASQNLAQSHLFSHEEAESMYMSAFSHATSSHVRQSMPGAWDGDVSGPDSSPRSSKRQLESPPIANDASPDHHTALSETGHDIRRSGAPVDNLHEAVHVSDDSFHDTPDSAEAHIAPSPTRQGTPLEEPIAEESSTPKGPTRLVKELISSRALYLWFPYKFASPSETSLDPSQSRVKSPGPLDYSVMGNVPGAFSVHRSVAQSIASVREPSPPAPGSHSQHSPPDDSIEATLSPLEVKFDLPTSFLLATVVTRILGALREPTGQAKAKTEPPSPSAPLPAIKIIFEKISVHFLEILSGIADTPERFLGARSTPFDVDALLSMGLENLLVNVTQSSQSTTTSLNVGKFHFGYANDDIVSFDQRIQMRSSVRDAFPSAGSDISLTVVQSSDSTRCEVKTLPLHVKLDLPRLDETFTWFGGLSGFLNLNSSISVTNLPATQTSPKVSQKPRGVRFDAPIRPDDISANSENKINMRMGGIRLDLLGKDCSVSLDTSAVKLVSREEGLGVGISKIQLVGPYIRQSLGDPPVHAMITNTRVEFLNTPKDNDLERLLELIIPSKHKFDQSDDEIMVDTLLRQRKKGSVLRIHIDDIDINVEKVQQLEVLTTLGEDFARLSTVAKYLPEDDRPGLLTLALIRNINAAINPSEKIGVLQSSFKDLELGHITMPSLLAVGLGRISLLRNHNEQLVSSVPPSGKGDQGPVVTMRIIGDEMEPIIRLRMQYLDVEYRVSTLMDLLDLGEDATPQEFETSLAASVANLGDHAHTAITGKATTSSVPAEQSKGKPTKVDIILHDCLLGLNPLGLPSKMIIVLTSTHFEVSLSKGDDANVLGHFNKASVLLIDDISVTDTKSPTTASRRRTSNAATPQVVELCQQGFVDVCYISSAKVVVQVGSNPEDKTKWVDVEVRDDLLVLETCADSTQTLIALANALSPPTPPKKEIKYRTNVVPMQDMLASISADAFGQAEGAYNFDDDFLAHELGDEGEGSFELDGSDLSGSLTVDSQFYDDKAALADSVLSEKTTAQDTTDGVLLTNFSSQPEDLDEDDDLVIHENYFSSGSVIGGTAHRWNSTKNAYDQSNDTMVHKSPLSVRIRDVHFIWNLFDGYDWDHTRDVISKAVHNIEATAVERQSKQDRARAGTDMEIVEEETVIGDFLFNSIYIGIPANRDPRELAQAINQELNDNATETESIATTAFTATPSRQGSRQGGTYRPKKRLRLNRSKRHKITFELKGINVDLIAFPPGSGETQSSIDVRVKDLVIFDHVPTSTWKKFATYDQDAGEREMDASMVHLEILNVKPLPELAAAEIVLKATVLPLRLHVDQDALDFITRFFEFKDDSKPIHASPSDVPFIQRAEVNAIPVTLDFKPKRVDYAGLRSGHTTEFMNFVVLDQSRMVLRRTIVYGASGFDRLGQTLNDTWMPDVKRNQLPGVLAGLAPVRSLVNVGSGFKDLVEIPIREYKKDGRIVRSISKGAAAFAKTTGTELVKLGAKLAVGTQYALQGAEGMLTKQPGGQEPADWDDEDADSEETKQISLYADQPTGVVQGLRGAYSSLARDLNLARDAIIAVPGEVMESGNAQGAAKAVLKRAPTIIFRPLIGSSKAIGQTLMGATNSLDPQNRRRVDEKYKRH